MPFYKGIRIEPADEKGINLVRNIGGESIYVEYQDIPDLINQLRTVLNDNRRDKGCIT